MAVRARFSFFYIALDERRMVDIERRRTAPRHGLTQNAPSVKRGIRRPIGVVSGEPNTLESDSVTDYLFKECHCLTVPFCILSTSTKILTAWCVSCFDFNESSIGYHYDRINSFNGTLIIHDNRSRQASKRGRLSGAASVKDWPGLC